MRVTGRRRLLLLIAFAAASLAVACFGDAERDAERAQRAITPFVPRTPVPTPTPAPTPAPTPRPPQDPEVLRDAQVRSLLALIADSVSANERSAVLRAMREHGDPRFVIPLIHVWAFSPADQREEVAEALAAIAGELPEPNSAHWFFDWYEWMVDHPDWPMPENYESWVARLMLQRRGIDFHRFLRPGETAEVRPELILWSGRPADGIPPLDQPAFATAGEADELLDDEIVFGVRIAGEARAYPLRIVSWHEVVNDRLGGTPVTLSYCPLSDSGILFATSQGAPAYIFGNAGLVYESTRLLYDRQTNTLWHHLTGEPVLGPLAGSGITLPRLPMVRTTWAEWRAQHPDTLVLTGQPGHEHAYEPGTMHREYLASDQINFPVAELDEALPPKSRVYALLADGRPRAFPLEALPAGTVLNDAVGDTPVVLVVDDGGGVRAYRRGDHELRAGNLSGEAGPLTLLDGNGGTWRVLEDELVGERDERLARLSGQSLFWFGWRAFYPATSIYEAS